ncbi:hypothetical protein PR202_gb29764 [Eleusine coracana subsp. coracana]|uniref:Pentatricopeptide repeat-containing protein n=1 Tax=Eleusine coracana subsp. coracana TaxID=191504 RepID=A0AAV5G077_ELECO|nr:hypothetical protein PR202_gb29764 [Eleusine coracana subsp. coracana]
MSPYCGFSAAVSLLILGAGQARLGLRRHPQLLTVIACAPASPSVRNGSALAVSLFNRMAQSGAKNVASDICTYNIIIACFCRMGHLDLGFAAFCQILKMGWRVDTIIFSHLLRALCAEKKMNDAMDIVLRRMPELGCTPDVFSYTILLKGLCDEKKKVKRLLSCSI